MPQFLQPFSCYLANYTWLSPWPTLLSGSPTIMLELVINMSFQLLLVTVRPQPIHFHSVLLLLQESPILAMGSKHIKVNFIWYRKWLFWRVIFLSQQDCIDNVFFLGSCSDPRSDKYLCSQCSIYCNWS